MRLRTILVGCALAGVVSASSLAQAGPELPGPPSPGTIGEQVASALYDRGMLVFELGDIASAKKLFAESLERSPKGTRAADALGMLRRCNEKLGLQDLDAGRPATGGPAEVPLDPYAGGSGSTDIPLDPYAVTPGAVDPNAAGAGEVPPNPTVRHDTNARSDLMITGGLWGFLTGLGVTGPIDDEGNLSGASIPVGLALGGGGIYLGYYLGDKFDRAKGKTISSGALWGMYNFAHFGNLVTGSDTTGNDVYKSMALGGLAGGGLGYWYANAYSPTEGNIAVTNTFSLLGTGVGLMLGVAMDPPRGDAYSLNATLGSMAGIGAGIYFQDDLQATEKRMTMVNLGAIACAAAPWILVYPFLDNDDNGARRTTGFLSTLTMAGGAYLAWYLTDNDEPGGQGGSASPALVQRDENGQWGVGAPMPKPMQNPTLAPAAGVSMGADVLSGRF